MSSYKFSPQQFICTKDPDEMKDWVDTYGKSHAEGGGNTMTHTNYPELMKNCEYRKKYNTLSAQEKMYDDTKATYDKTWRQTANLSLGICILLVGIFYQN